MKKKWMYLGAILCSLSSSCDQIFLYKELPNDPIHNYDCLWSDFDQLYGGFIARNINWDSLNTIFRQQIYSQMSDEMFYNVITGLLDQLNDNHVTLIPCNPSLKHYQSGILGRMSHCNDFRLSVVRDHYLTEFTRYSDEIVFGKFAEGIGYIHFLFFGESVEAYEKAMDKILDKLKNTKGVIIDIRCHNGGDDRVGKYIAGRFSKDKRLFMTVRLKNGPGHGDFAPPIAMSVEPEKGLHYEKPIVLMTNRFSVSAAETFAFAIRTIDNITQIGDTTSGAFADEVPRELPNGWVYTIGIGDWRDKNNISWEGIGIAPDITIQNDSTEIANGIDRALEKAIAQLR